MKRAVGSRLPIFSKEESEQVKGSSDFIGIMHYFPALVENIKLKPSLSRNTDFYSDMGVSLTCRNQHLNLLYNKTNSIVVVLVFANHLFSFLLVGDRPWQFFRFRGKSFKATKFRC